MVKLKLVRELSIMGLKSWVAKWWCLGKRELEKQSSKPKYTPEQEDAQLSSVKIVALRVTNNESPTKHQDHRAEIIRRLRGQEIQVPDVRYIYTDWEARVHPGVEILRQHLEGFFQTFIGTESLRKKQRRVDNGLCAGQFYTSVETDKLLVLGELVAWFFFWDDEIDCGTLTNDREKTEAYCDDSLNFIRHCLQPERQGDVPVPGRLHNCGPWVSIGKAMNQGQSKEARDRFAEAIYDFILGVRTSQATWARGISTLEDYTARRLRTVGTNPCVAVLQWAYGLTLPQCIWNHEAVLAITREVAISDFLWNDIVSLRKEIDDGDIDSAIPVIVWNEGCSAQSAVDQCVKMVEQSWTRLLNAEKRLITAYANEEEYISRDIKMLVGGCKDIIAGHMVYSLKIPRNMAAAKMSEKDWSFRMVL
ncbi:terpene synthase [Pyrenophora seminiperda CCB06]|uniref:Terpene synthase n=1 Tax=Pyrenophora seminiperda CCB06 TaxID=1302712 RepID=A0A3M7M180_9PLEO|nr:terpene synthase [Pyrenophora seminiperda CCB06]